MDGFSNGNSSFSLVFSTSCLYVYNYIQICSPFESKLSVIKIIQSQKYCEREGGWKVDNRIEGIQYILTSETSACL